MIEEMPTIAQDEKLPESAADIGVPEKNSDKVVRDYQEAIYEHLPPTIVREVSSNAIDAHRMHPVDIPAPINAGAVDVGDEFLDLFAEMPRWRMNSPITAPHLPRECGDQFRLPVGRNVEVDLSTGKLLGESSQPVFTVTDWGPGMSPEFMNGPVTEYRTTGKGHTNRLIGGKGIGALCPLGYRDTFLWDVCWEGVMRTYVFQRHQDGDKLFALREEEYESRPFGTRVRVPVGEEDTEDFKKACVEQLTFLSGEINFKGDLPQMEPPAKEVDGEGFSVIEEDVINYPFEHSGKALKTPLVTIGGVPYDLNLSKVNQVDSLSADGLVIKLGPGDVDLTLSRDSLKYTDKTKESVAEAIQESVVPGLKSDLTQKAGDIEDLTPLESKLLKHALRQDPSEYDNVPQFVEENQKSISLIRKLDEVNFSFVSKTEPIGNLKKVQSNYGKADYKFSKAWTEDISKILSGSIPVYWTTSGSKGPVNRKLNKRHNKFYLWRLHEDSIYLDEAKRRFKSYDEVEVEDRHLNVEVEKENDDEFAAYEWSVSKGKFAKNYETPSSLQNLENVVYGHKADRKEIKILARLKYFHKSNLKDLDYAPVNAVIRLAKSNASHAENAGHTYIGNFDYTEEMKTRLARQYNAYKLAQGTRWFRHFEKADETQKLYRLWNQVRQSSSALLSRKPTTSSYATSGRSALHKVGSNEFPANVADQMDLSQKYPDGIGPLARRLRQWEEKLYALKEETDNLGEGYRNCDDKANSIITLIGPSIRRMTDIPEIHS